MSVIENLKASEILDSRGNPTIQVVCILQSGEEGMFAVPSGASTGKREACELRDGEDRFGGKGVLKAVFNVQQIIAKEICGKDWNQETLDQKLISLDGTSDKHVLGANAVLGVSVAFAKAEAKKQHIPLYKYMSLEGVGADLPEPFFNIINGGKHADSGLSIQEFMIAPLGIKTVRKKVQAVSEIVHTLKTILEKEGFSVSVGDEGGFAPKLPDGETVCEYIVKAITDSGYTTNDVKIALDVAASSFYKDGKYYVTTREGEKIFSSEELVVWYEKLIEEFPIISIEDPCAEDDWEGFREVTKKIGSKIKIIGDDLTVTNVACIKKAKDFFAINAVLIKPNQIGSLSETLQAIKETHDASWDTCMSHRSGETNDSFIVDLAVSQKCKFIKAGSVVRGERVAKYNRLMAIEDELG